MKGKDIVSRGDLVGSYVCNALVLYRRDGTTDTEYRMSVVSKFNNHGPEASCINTTLVVTTRVSGKVTKVSEYSDLDLDSALKEFNGEAQKDNSEVEVDSPIDELRDETGTG